MRQGTSLDAGCPNPLTNTNVTPNSETLNCASNTTTTTSTTTTVPPTTTTTSGGTTTTTTVPDTTTTVPSTTTTTTTIPGGGGGNCTNPIFSTSEATGTINTDPGPLEYWWVDNDAWSGSHGPQTINVCSNSSWYAVSNQTNVQGQVETYPNTEYDVGGRNNPGYPSTKPISAYTSITSTFDESFPTTGNSIDSAYDLWTNNWSNETMIWNQYTGTQTYWSNCAANPATSVANCGYQSYAVNLGAVPYHVLNLGGEVIFFRDTQVAAGSVDLLAAFNVEVIMGWAKSTDAPTQLEYGVEICSTPGPQTFPLNNITFNLS